MLYSRLTISRFYLFLNGFISFSVLSACHATPAPLNSERIAQRYGNFGIEILYAGDLHRTTSLYSESNAGITMRTLARVEFTAADNPNVATEHELILDGGSIGAVFKEAGWTINKVSPQYCLLQADFESLPELQRMEILLPANLATHTYVFRVQKEALSIDYATITEIHHPDYLQAEDFANGNLDDC
jgi:hypothetical protein